ncbi:MAG: phosphoribosyltransferase family protein [Patescibacteria group bacterium]|nr:phosphoribosyltransferase family protein [Patescibacteria group bacterium]
MKFLYISWEEIQDHCFQFSKQIIKEKIKFDRIICISRGGLVISRILSDFLKLPISNFTIVSYASVGKTGKPKIVEKLAVNIKGESILLVDEITDQGTTLKFADSYLKSLKPKKITTFTPIIKPWSNPLPDYWQLKTNKWVVFSYDVRETIDDLKKIYKKENKSLKGLEKIIKKFSFNSQQAKYFLNLSG